MTSCDPKRSVTAKSSLETECSQAAESGGVQVDLGGEDDEIDDDKAEDQVLEVETGRVLCGF